MIKLCILLSALIIVVLGAYDPISDQERLMIDLFLKYDATKRPSINGSRTDVRVSIALEHFDFRERDGSFHFVGTLVAKWTDTNLRWNPIHYGYVTELPISQKIAWVPDLEFYNNAPDKFFRTHKNGVLVLSNTGEFVWLDTIEVSMFCSADMDNWPHDSHSCKLSLGSWTHHALDMDITNAKPNESMEFDEIKQKNMEYKITEYSAAHVSTTYSCCSEPYTTIDYNITLQRNSDFVIVFRVSAFCVMIFSIMSLIGQPDRSEKLWLNGFSLLVIVINLIYFAKQIGSFTHGTPSIVLFFKNSMVFVTLAQLVCVFCLMASRSKFRGQLPDFCRQLLKNRFVMIIAPETASSVQQEMTASHSRFEDVRLQESSNLITVISNSSEWAQLSRFVQRCGLILLIIGFAILESSCYV